MDTGALNVLHDAGNEGGLAIADGVHLRLLAFEVLIDEDGLPFAHSDSLGEITYELGGVLEDLHSTAPEYVAGPHEHRVADKLGGAEGVLHVVDGSARRLGYAQPLHQVLEAGAVLGDVDHLSAGAEDGLVGTVEGRGQVYRRLATELDDGGRPLTVERLVLQQVTHRLLIERLEVEAVTGIEVGGDGLGVGVDHDRLQAGLLEGPGGVHGAVVELYPLADADGPAADNERAVALQRRRLILLIVGAVEVGRLRLELGGAGVDHLVHGAHAPLMAEGAHLLRQPVGQRADDGVGESEPFRLSQELRGQRLGEEALLHLDDTV